MFRKTRDGGASSAQTVGLPEERKTLAERYTIDAKEAESRAQRAVEEERRRETEAERRSVAPVETRPEAVPVPARLDTVKAEPTATTTVQPAARAFPIYGWLQQATPAPDDTTDWARALLRTAEEERRDAAPPV